MKKKSILVACCSLDYILIRKILIDSFLIDRAEGVEEIMEMRKNKKYDLLLLDVAFLKPDFKVISGVGAEHIPVIALSSEPSDARNQQMKKAGCCACYVKPIRNELFNFVNHWIEKHR